MRPFKSVSRTGIFCLLFSAPVLMSGTRPNEADVILAANSAKFSTSSIVNEKQSILDEAHVLYDSMKLKRVGLTRTAFEFAWQGYKHLIETRKIYKKEVLSICDFSQSSKRKRLYIIDVASMKVLVNTYVAHGRRSGGEYAKSFSNNPDSHKSSLGFFVTRKTYYGGHGLALTIDGLEDGINNNADQRKIVVHGSEYVGANFLRSNKFNGRSFGCPAVPAKETQKVINTIKDGSCLFIYHPSKNYITKSKILND